MDIQRENQTKQHKENLERQHEQQQRLAPVRLQDAYNKENLDTQHKYNLEIFEKQAALTRDIQEKQARLAKISMLVVASSTFLAAVIAVILGIYLERNWLKKPLQSSREQPIITTEKQKTLVVPTPGEKETTKATQSFAPAESSPKKSKPSSENVSSKTP